MKLSKFIQLCVPPIFYAKLFKLKGKNTYDIGLIKVKIPSNHNLPNIQKTHRLYDRFLPVLAKNINCDKIIVDVGANIGDTAIALVQNCKNPMILIEPSEVFLPYLEHNIKLLSSDDISRISIINKFVGTGFLKGVLKHSIRGTASIEVNNESDLNTHVSLDSIVNDTSNIILLKVDTDGFDFDVIKSSEEILTNSEPILFFENEISEDFQFDGYDQLYTLLLKKGYRYIYIFDNFGNLITEENNFDTLKNINSYLYSIKKHNNTRTFYYTDICASTEKNHFLVINAINEYKRNWIKA